MNEIAAGYACLYLVGYCPDRLSSHARQAILSSENSLFLSLVSVWEIQIKMQLGKLRLNNSLSDTLNAQQQINGIQLLPIEVNHILALASLPAHHHDPFDRLLIAQTQTEELTLLSNDNKIQHYDIPLLW